MAKLLFRLIIGVVFAGFALLNYLGSVSENPITGEQQRVALSFEEEVILGQRGRQEVFQEFGGPYRDPQVQAYISEVGQQVVADSEASQLPYPYEFHVLNDPNTINAFALPGGQIFITTGLLARLTSEAQLAGVLGHEVGHVVARHGAEHLARQQLGAALVGAIGVAASDDPNSARQAAMIAQAVNQIVNLRYGREDELESDRLGFDFMVDAEYNPEGIVELMQILDEASQGERPPEFLSTHPDPGNRVQRLQELIAAEYPSGVPEPLVEGEQRFNQMLPARL